MAAKGSAANIIVTGATGTGKTTHCQTHFVDPAPRAVILDYYGDWEARDGLATDDFAAAIDYMLSEGSKEKMRLVYRDADVDRCLKILHFANEMQKTVAGTRKSLVCVQEEAWRFTDTTRIPPLLHVMYTGARRWGIANVSISLRDVNLHPTIRAMSQVHIAFQNMKLSADTVNIFGKRSDLIYSLQPMQWPKLPEENVNFLQTPEGFDTVSWWQGIVL